MLKFILGLIIGGVGVWLIKSRLDSRRRGNDRPGNPNAEAIEKKQKNLKKGLELALNYYCSDCRRSVFVV